MSEIDLGSTPVEDFNPFADEDELDAPLAGEGADAASEVEQSQAATQTAPPVTISTPSAEVAMAGDAASDTPKEAVQNDDGGGDDTEPENPIAAAIDTAETNEAVKARQGLSDKQPVFDYAGATENIDDASLTFDELRIAKAADFPELDDGKRVSWTVEYGKISKAVTDTKGTTIAKMKSDIETSKEFLNALKKAKDKNPVCKVKPRVTAQSKGVMSASVAERPSASTAISSYKGVFTNMDEVVAAGKTISVLPAKDGKVYEVRKNPLGMFITPVTGSELLSDVRAGFIPACGIPRIPKELIMQIIAFFRYYTFNGLDKEVLVNVYWDKRNKEFVVDAPEQVVSKASVHSCENPDYLDDRYIHFMDIHSHNSMKAFFSHIDDKDEKATRLYTVIGRLDAYMPQIKTRISNGGKFLEIDPGEVFEYMTLPFPQEWKDGVSFRASHKDDKKSDCLSNRGNKGGLCGVDELFDKVGDFL